MQRVLDSIAGLSSALRDAFVALLPFVFILSLLNMLVQIARFLGVPDAVLADYAFYVKTLYQFLAIAEIVSIAYYLALYFRVGRMNAVLLSLSVYFTIAVVVSPDGRVFEVQESPLGVLSLLVPIVAVSVFTVLLHRPRPAPDGAEILNITVYTIFRSLVQWVIAYFVVVGLFLGLNYLHLLHILESSFRPLLPGKMLLFVRAVLIQFSWFVGIHGAHLVNTFWGTKWLGTMYIFPHLGYGKFYRLFALSGGAGVGLSLFIAFLFVSKERRIKRLLRFSSPFLLFNLNEPLIYGIPVVYNRHLLLPFLLVPLLNMSLAYAVLSLWPVSFLDIDVPWSTPPLLDGYLASGGNLFVVGLQLFLILLGAAIYYPFAKRSCAVRSYADRRATLEHRLGLAISQEAEEDVLPVEAQKFIVEASDRLDYLFRLIGDNTLSLYYQPEISMKDHRCDSCEALLRIRMDDGSVHPPFFLEDLEKAHLASLIDIWVAKRVKQDLLVWRAHGFRPVVSINLHPQTLKDPRAIRRVVETLADEEVEFEIVERAFLGDSSLVRSHMRMLGERIALDDFGVGFSSLKMMLDFPISKVKIDGSLLAELEDTRRLTFYQQIVNLCKALGIKVVAEGVETADQMEFVRRAGVDYVQGFYLAVPMPPEALETFALRFGEKRGGTFLPGTDDVRL